MTQAQHTPGPWKHQPNIGVIANGREIARTIVADAYETVDYEEAWANARLIAAAPELLAACQAALRWFRLEHADRLCVAPPTDELEAAIAKLYQ